jgi:hypothetical protein
MTGLIARRAREPEGAESISVEGEVEVDHERTNERSE